MDGGPERTSSLNETLHPLGTVGHGNMSQVYPHAGAYAITGTGHLGSFVPEVGQRFATFEEAQLLLETFAEANDFVMIILRSQRPGGKLTQVTFGCYRSGSFRPSRIDPVVIKTVKTNCPFQINLRLSEALSCLKITKVELHHNHPLDMSSVSGTLKTKRPSMAATLHRPISDKVVKRPVGRPKKPKDSSSKASPSGQKEASSTSLPVLRPNSSAMDHPPPSLHHPHHHHHPHHSDTTMDYLSDIYHLRPTSHRSGKSNPSTLTAEALDVSQYELLSGLELTDEMNHDDLSHPFHLPPPSHMKRPSS